jgi:hypothetical protein
LLVRLIRFIHAGSFFLGMGLGSLLFSVGCGDDSKKSGTHVEVTEQQKREMDDMNAAIKADRAAQKKAR